MYNPRTAWLPVTIGKKISHCGGACPSVVCSCLHPNPSPVPAGSPQIEMKCQESQPFHFVYVLQAHLSKKHLLSHFTCLLFQTSLLYLLCLIVLFLYWSAPLPCIDWQRLTLHEVFNWWHVHGLTWSQENRLAIYSKSVQTLLQTVPTSQYLMTPFYRH